MNSVLVMFENFFQANSFQAQSKILRCLMANCVFIDEVYILSSCDSKMFISFLNDDSISAVFIECPSLQAFSVKEILKSSDINLNSDGVYAQKKFVALLPNKCSVETVSPISKAFCNYFSICYDKIVFKTFGLTLENIKNCTDNISKKYQAVKFVSQSDDLDVKTILFFDNTVSRTNVDKAVKEFLIAFKNNVYAEDDVLPEERLVEILKLRRLNLSTCESITGGRIASKIVSVYGASQVFYEGLVTYNTASKLKRVGVSEDSVKNFGVVSSQVAFEMSKGLLADGNVDIAVSITGFAGSKELNNKNDGLCYIGIGLVDNIEVYKFNFDGTRKQIINSAANASLFLAIKTIMNM